MPWVSTVPGWGKVGKAVCAVYDKDARGAETAAEGGKCSVVAHQIAVCVLAWALCGRRLCRASLAAKMETAQQGSGSVCLAFKRHAREAEREGSKFRVLSAACAFPATGPPVEVGVTAVCE